MDMLHPMAKYCICSLIEDLKWPVNKEFDERISKKILIYHDWEKLQMDRAKSRKQSEFEIVRIDSIEIYRLIN